MIKFGVGKNIMIFALLLSHTIFGSVSEDFKRIVSLKEHYFPNPAYYKSFWPGYTADEVNPYELRALISLELREQIKKQLQKDALFLKADRLIVLIISTMLSEVDSEKKAISEWHKLPILLGRQRSQFTRIQQAILDAPDEKIIEFYHMARECVAKLPEIAQEMRHRIFSVHKFHDQRECDQTATRSINLLRIRNIRMTIKEEYLDIIKDAYRKNPDYPILEQLKNYQIFNIGNFDNSKGAFIVHDMFDHFWFYMKLEKIGFLNNYSHLLLQIGNPHATDIFSREGELIATISAHFRWLHFSESNYIPLFRMQDIITIFENSNQNGTLTENQKRAYNFVKSIEENSPLYKAIPFILSGMSIQMLKYITLNGFPKKLNELYQPIGYFDVLDPEHVAFVVEGCQYLFVNYDQVIKVLLHVTMWIENYLVGIALGIEKDDLVINLEEAEHSKNEDDFCRLSYKKIKWMKEHIGFEVVRYPVGQE